MGAYAESILMSDTQVISKPWMRRVQIILTSNKADSRNVGLRLTIGDNQYGQEESSVTFGDSIISASRSGTISNGENFNIRIDGVKHLALAEDSGTITITNMSINDVALIMAAELYKIEVKVGYKSTGDLITVAKGAVSFISQKIHSRHDVDTYITYASEWVASWSQSRINFTASSGVNYYNLVEHFLYNQGVSNYKISKNLKNQVLLNAYSASGTSTTVVESALATQSGTSYCLSSDSSETGTVIDISNWQEKRVIKIDPNVIMIQGGQPTVTSSGLSLKIFPVINLVPGDILKLDNGIIDVSSGMNNADSVSTTFNTSYLDSNGCYIINVVNYHFANRADDFYFEVKGYALDKYKNLTS